MAKYMYLFRGGEDVRSSLSPEDMQAHMQIWVNWMKDLSEKGKLIDGLPLRKDGGKVVSGKNKVVSDGPYAEGKEVVGGYLIVNADSIEEATEISLGCPIYEHDGEVEIREILNMDA